MDNEVVKDDDINLESFSDERDTYILISDYLESFCNVINYVKFF